MFQQLLKLMWKGKRKNFLVLLEIFFSFMVLFATSTIIIKTLNDYWRPKGFDHERVHVLNMHRSGETGAIVREKIRSIRNLVRTTPEIESFSFSEMNFPYSNTSNNAVFSSETGRHKANLYQAEPGYMDIFKLELIKGRWLQKDDQAISTIPVVVNEHFAEKMFPEGGAIGQVISTGNYQYSIVGVVKGFYKSGEFSGPDNAVFEFHNPDDTTNLLSNVVFRVKAGVDPQWQQRFIEQANAITGTWAHELSTVEDARVLVKRARMTFVIAPAIVCAFLIINVAMGLFGVLWQNISRRYAEIGLRRAVGATQGEIRMQIVGEMLALTTLALMISLLLAIQFPLLGVFDVSNSIYALAIGMSLLIVYIVVAACTLYPSIQASRIEPAIALHYE
jgi:putative ABC transport system permease protein